MQELSAPVGSRDAFLVARRVFAAVLGVIHFFAFFSLAGQVRGLFGAQGIVPAEEFLAAVRKALGAAAWWEVPTICWLGTGDGFLVGLCVTGCVVALLLAAGIFPGPCAVALWGLFLSLCAVGSPFLNFQWDALLLETTLLAAFYLPWPARPDWGRESGVQRLARWLLAWLLFRLMFESGVVKLSSGDETWRRLTALDYHFETQPLPLWPAWYVSQLPHWILAGMTLAMFAIELLAPWGIFAPRRYRHCAAGALIALQAAILVTGNYAYFNWLTIGLCLLLFEDRCWPAAWRARWNAGKDETPEAPWRLRSMKIFAGSVIFLTALPLAQSFAPHWRWPEPFSSLESAAAPFESFNSYGLFRVMTTRRLEIELEGSLDGVTWQAYQFRWKPGDLRARPAWAAPLQPRLDWQMWFAALSDYRDNPWLMRFAARLLQGSPAVLSLLEWNPFPKEPPRYVRAVAYAYHFTKWGEESGAWWARERLGFVLPGYLPLRPRFRPVVRPDPLRRPSKSPGRCTARYGPRDCLLRLRGLDGLWSSVGARR